MRGLITSLRGFRKGESEMIYVIITIGYLLVGFIALITGYKTNSYSFVYDEAEVQKFVVFFLWPLVLLLSALCLVGVTIDRLAKWIAFNRKEQR